jgi:hypothetical protein
VLDRRLAVIRCTWLDAQQHPRDYADGVFRGLFTLPGDSLGVARFWQDCAFGLLDLTRDVLVPWTQMEATQDAFPRDELIRRAMPVLEVEEGGEWFWGYVVFMDPPPSDGAASGVYTATVLDWAAGQTHMAHEVGHVLGFEHSCGSAGNDYGDPYCVMSAHTFGGKAATFTAGLSELDPGVSMTYWNEMGPMPAAATLYAFIDEFAKSGAVSRFDADSGFAHPMRLKALSHGTLDDPLIAVVRVGDREWTAEYREPSGWDRGLSEPGVVIHTVQQTQNGNHAIRPCYQGRIRVPLRNGARDWQDVTDDIRVLVSAVDDADHSVNIQFSRRVTRAVSLATSVKTTAVGPPFIADGTFPIMHGLCGEGTFEYFVRRQVQAMDCIAEASGGYDDPIYTWRVNGQQVGNGSSDVSVTVSAYRENGLPPVPAPTTVTLHCTVASNRLTIVNEPADGTYELTVDVAMTEKSTFVQTVTATAIDGFRGIAFDSPDQDKADQDCRNRFRRRFEQQHGNLDLPFIDKGDPVWTGIQELPGLSPRQRSDLAERVSIARGLSSIDAHASHTLATGIGSTLGLTAQAVLAAT